MTFHLSKTKILYLEFICFRSILDPEDQISDILKFSPTVSNDYVPHLHQVLKKS
jgi:hypothetical protein